MNLNEDKRLIDYAESDDILSNAGVFELCNGLYSGEITLDSIVKNYLVS